MVSVASRLYRIEDELMTVDRYTSTAIMIYDIDSTQPYMANPIVIDPDRTRVLIDSAKLSGTKKSIWTSLDGNKLMSGLIGVVIVGIILYSILTGGGL